jgi:hypothetical protein
MKFTTIAFVSMLALVMAGPKHSEDIRVSNQSVSQRSVEGFALTDWLKGKPSIDWLTKSNWSVAEQLELKIETKLYIKLWLQ